MDSFLKKMSILFCPIQKKALSLQRFTINQSNNHDEITHTCFSLFIFIDLIDERHSPSGCGCACHPAAGTF